MIIYLATNEINGKQYVGQTIHTLTYRWSQHRHAAFKQNSQNVLAKALRKHGVDTWTVKVIDTATSREELDKKEIDYIVKLNTHYLQGDGYNMSFGGDSNRGIKQSPETVAKKIAKQNKAIVCIETGKVFGSIREAAFELKVSPGFIGNVLHGRKSTAKGFTFKYLNNEDANILAQQKEKAREIYRKEHFTSGRSIVCLSNGIVFSSIKEAARQIGVAEVNFRKALKRENRTCKGLIFQFEDQLGV
jgi:group I intron endonuclease